MSERLSSDLHDLLGEAAFIALAEHFGGLRLYIPQTMTGDHDIAKAIGLEEAQRLSNRYGADRIAVPLARAIRARHYRAHGLSNSRIARKLGIRLNAVEKIFARMDCPPEKGSKQLSLDI